MRASRRPSSRLLLSTGLIAAALVLPFASLAQQAAAGQNIPAGSHPLITQMIEESRLTVLKGNTHRLARPEFDLGAAPASLPLQRMLLVLKRSAAQETALRQLLDNQQDKASASYHKWLTPTQFGQQFGPSDGDIHSVTSWLQSHGFQVGSTKGRSVLEFSGSASQVQETFHTAIHKYVVSGEQHWANSTDPQIPTALTPAVAGVLTLHDFFKKPLLRTSHQSVSAKIRPGKSPALTFSDGSHGMAPADFSVIYSKPTTPTGAGVTIGVIGRSNLYSVDSPGEDITDFRSSQTFNICCGSFNIILNGPDPGDLGGGEEGEATLDSSWSGAVAPDATIDFVVSASTNTADGIDLSEVYIIENNLADVMTESFGTCEGAVTSAEAAGTSALAEQAAAQGITYFVSTGDDGAEGCDDENSETVATGPVSVNILASTPFDVAVGGTVFDDTADPTLYWSATNLNQSSALGYIPQDVWNDSCLAANCGTSANIVAGSGGASIFFTKPSWQTGATGIVNDNARDIPDVSLTASIHDGYVVCWEASCVPDSQGEFFLYLFGGTSASAPSFAGIMALVDQQMASLNPGQGPRQGLANYVLYRLATSQNSTLAQCSGSSASALPGNACIFQDITVGNNAVPGEVNYGLATADYQATAGYDLATGLGSVNISNLVSQWNSVTFSPTITTLTPPVISIAHGSAVDVTVTVAPSSGTGVAPTGDVSLLAAISSGLTGQTAVDGFTLSNGTVTQATSQLPGGGPYNLTARYAGDATYAPSTSTPVSVTVTPEASTTTLSVLTFDSQGNQFNFTSGPFGSFVYLRADVAGVSGHGTPTGTVNFADTFGPIPGGNSYPLNGGDQFSNGSNTASPNGVTFDTGTHTISASYLGDVVSFNPSNSAPPITFTISPGFFASIAPNAVVSISAPGSSGSTSVSVVSSGGFTGTITLACAGLPSEATCNFSLPTITASGTLTTTNSTITVTTTAATSSLLPPDQPHLPRWLAASGFMIFSVVLIGLPRRRAPLGLFLLLALIVVAPACGGGSSTHTPPPPPPNPGTPVGVYTVNVMATSGSATSTTSFALNLQ